MTFSTSSGLITQTGTDPAWGQLNNEDGVEEFGTNHTRFYEIQASTRVVIDGTVDGHHADNRVLIFNQQGSGITLLVNGTYIFGQRRGAGDTAIDQNGDLLLFIGDARPEPDDAAWNIGTYGGLVVASGGTLETVGGTVRTKRSIGFQEGAAEINIRGTTFVKYANIPDNPRRELRFEETDADDNANNYFDGIVDGMTITHRRLPPTFKVKLLDSNINMLARNAVANHDIIDLDTSGNPADYDLGTDSFQNTVVGAYAVYGSTAGSGLRLMPKQGVGDTRQLGVLVVNQYYKLVIKDEDGDGIEGVRWFYKNGDHGHGKSANGHNSAAGQEFHDVTDENGEYDGVAVTAITNINTNGSFVYTDWDTTNHSKRYKVDRYGKHDNDTDLFDFKLASYFHVPSTAEFALKGLGRIELNWTLFEDNEITETDTDDVLDYTKLETPTKLYDYIKKFWVDSLGSYGGNDLYATKSGETLNFGSWDLFMAANHSNTVQYELGDAIHQGGSIWQSTGDISGPFD